MMTLNSPMTSTWLFVLGALILAVLLSVVIIWPWLRQRKQSQHTANTASDDALLTQNVALFKQRLAELDADYARGEVDDESFNLQKVELQRQLLAATADVKLAHTGKTPISKTSVLAMLVWPSLLMLMGYLMVGDRRQVFEYWQAKDRYDWLANELLSGALSEPPQSFYADDGVDTSTDAKRNVKNSANASQADADAQQRMVKRTQQLIQSMQSETHAHAGDATYWLNMSQAYMALQETPSALESLARAQRLAPDNHDIAMTYAQVNFFSAGGQLNADTRSILQQVLKKSPYHEGAQMLMAMGEVKAENLPQAEYWINRLKRTLIDKGGERTDAIASLNQLIQVIADKKRQLADAMVVKVTVSANLQGQLAPDATLFVVAKSAEGGAPFAVKRLPVAQLLASENKSITVKLSDSDAMLPSRTLSTAKRDKIPLFFMARISKSGNAIAQTDDLTSENIASTSSTQPVDVVIDRPYQPTS